MTDYPLHRGERQELRDHHRARILAAVREDADRYGWSIMCRHGSHAPYGCRNNGTGCLCECHDPNATAETNGALDP